MSPLQSTSSKTAENHSTDLRAVLTKYIYHWPLFLLCLVLALAGAYAYIKVVNPVYGISASILVKDEKKSPQEKSEEELKGLGQSGSSNNAEAEIQVLKSKNLIDQVVNNLQLWVTYKKHDGFKSQDLYASPPFKFFLIKKTGQLTGQKIEVLIKDKNTFEVKDQNGNPQAVAFNQKLKNDFGTWVLRPTNFLNKYIGSAITITVKDPESVSNAYVKSLDIHLLDKSAPTIGLFISDEAPKRGADVLNYLIKTYNEATSAEEKRTAKSTIDFIDKRLASLTGELSHAENRVEGYRSSQGLTDIDAQAKTYLENVQANDMNLNEVNVQLNTINGIEHYLNSPATTASAPATMGITDPGLNKSIEQLSELQQKKAALLATTPESNPVFEPINRQINTAKTAISETIQGLKTSLNSKEKELQNFNHKFESSIKDLPGQERQFVDMKRQESIKENLYVYLLQKREEMALSYASNLVDARIVDKGSVVDIKWPKTSLILAIALLLGLGIPFLAIYFRESFNNSITERRDIESALDIPILGELSYEDLGKNIFITDQEHRILSEQFRSLRTNLHYLYDNKKGKDDIQPITPTLNSTPLYVIDGFPSDVTTFKSLSPVEIQGVNVLRPPSSVALYGLQAANGVVIVTTNHAKNGEVLRLANGHSQVSDTARSHMHDVQNPTLIKNPNSSYGQILKPTSQALVTQTNWQRNTINNGLNGNHSYGNKGRVTLFTSSVSSEGTSFVSSNLAASLAVSGRKTVILEMNLRKPTISKSLNISKNPGIIDFLSSDIETEEIIQPSGIIDNLDIIGSGQTASNPSELLEKERLEELIDDLKERYDDIIIDSPPMHLVTDAMIIAKLADVSLYIIRQGHTGKSELNFISDIHQAEKLPNMNIVFNGINKQKYGYGSDYDKTYYNDGHRKLTFNGSLKLILNRF
jgi:tyrosine-protein kinase Etk/Wzc